jgi:hypothetical protein
MNGSLVTASTAGTESSAKTILAHPEAGTVILRGDGDNASHPCAADGARCDDQLALFLPAPQQPDGCEYEQREYHETEQ